MKPTKMCIAAAMLLLMANVHGQAPAAAGAAAQPGAPGGGRAGGPPGREVVTFDNGFDFASMFATKLSDKAPKPSADPRNLEGVWSHREMLQGRMLKTITGDNIPYGDAAKKTLTYRSEMENKGSPVSNASALCYPPGPTWQFDLNFPFQIVQRKNFTYFVFHEFHGRWEIRMNQKHNVSGPRAYMGDSIGYWDGNTLVVDAINFKDDMWLDPTGTPLSKDAHVTYRIRKIEGGQAFEMVTTVDDPKLYTKPWSFARTYSWGPDKFMMAEYNCEQQVGSKGGAASYGVVEGAGAAP